MSCPNCGGSIIGDGYTEVMHCEFAEESLYSDKEPDASVVYCSNKKWHPEVLEIGRKFPYYSQPDGIPGLTMMGISTNGENFIILESKIYYLKYSEDRESRILNGKEVRDRVEKELDAVEKYLKGKLECSDVSYKYFTEKMDYYRAWIEFLKTHDNPFEE